MKYDVFISCKSEDYKYGKEIYTFLTEELGYLVFLADAELRKKGISEYGEVIDDALDAAKHLILFASNIKYINSSYVKNEWRTFLEEKRSGRKQGNILTILKDINIASLPISLRQFQSFPYDKYKEVADFLPNLTTHNALVDYVPTTVQRYGPIKSPVVTMLQNENDRQVEEVIASGEELLEKQTTPRTSSGIAGWFQKRIDEFCNKILNEIGEDEL